MPRCDVPNRPPQLSRASILTGEPVTGREWSSMGRALNYLLGSGGMLIPAYYPGNTIAASGTATYRFVIWPRRQASHRQWVFGLSIASGRAAVTFTDPSGGTRIFDVQPRAVPYAYGHVETIASPTASETQIAPTLAVVAGGATVTVTQMQCYELPRLALPGDATELGVDLSTLLVDTPIFNDTGKSVGGLAAQVDSARDVARRNGLFAWATHTTSAISTNAGPVALFAGEPSMLGRSLYSGDTVRTVQARAYVRAGASTSGKVTLTMASGDTVDLVIPSGSAGEWVSGEVDVHAEDLTKVDGRRSSTWDAMTATIQRDSGADSVYVESLILGGE